MKVPVFLVSVDSVWDEVFVLLDSDVGVIVVNGKEVPSREYLGLNWSWNISYMDVTNTTMTNCITFILASCQVIKMIFKDELNKWGNIICQQLHRVISIVQI